ncbi:MAG: twin-arginine translocase subunit TatC [Gemmatimonadota bacterium]
MPFLDHLEELRWRLLKSIAAILIGTMVGFFVVTHFNVLELLIDPLRQLIGEQKLKYLSPGDPFFVTLGLAITVGLLLAFPIVAAQVWAFISPALLPREKRAIVPALYLGLVLFAAGVALAYYIVLPMTLKFFMGFQTATLEQNIVIGPYISLVVKVLLAFGILFELPVVVLVLSALGLVTSKFLAEKRRYAIAGIALVAAFATPGDAITLTIFMMGPLILLYELSILLARLVERRRRRSLTMATAALFAVLFVAPAAQAQQPQQQDTARPRTTREVVLDKLRTQRQAEVRDTTASDSLAVPPERATPAPQPTPQAQQQPGADFPTDSITRELLQLRDFAATQYRGTAADFVADSQRLVLFGKPDEKAGVVRDGQIMTADSLLTFDEVTAVACGYGKPVLTGGASDAPVESRLLCYDTRQRIGMAAGARTQISEGANWFVTGDLYSRDRDIYTHDANFTDCSLEIPHYHFAAKEVKIVNRDVMVARNVTLNFGDVPVFWLPFMMQSMKRGRRSGILMPEFSVNDIVRRNANYNRRIRDVGFYWAISENLGSQLSLDWFSGNYTALEGSFDYSFVNRFMQGGATLRRFWRTTGSREFTLAANHNWEPSERMGIRADLQYTSSTALIQQSSYDPRELRRDIRSNASISRRFGWGSVNTQLSRTQSLSDDRVDYTLPSIGVTFATLTLFPAVGESKFYNNAVWTSNASVSRTGTQFADTDFDPTGLAASATSSFNMGRLSWAQGFTSNFARAQGTRGGDTTKIFVASQTMRWNTSLGFQQRLIGTSTFTPSLSLGQDLIRNDTIAGNPLVRGPVRMDLAAAVRADVFGFWPGIGPISRLRHRLSPSITYTYSPAATINPLDSLRVAIFGANGARERNSITIGMSQTIEGKYREDPTEGASADSAAIDSTSTDPTKPRRLPQARKVTVLSLSTDAVVYDFVAGRTGQGIQTTTISNSLNSDLLRGLQLTITHDLFKPVTAGDGTTMGEQADRDFAPHLSRVNASFSLSNNSWLFRLFGLGKQTDAPPPTGSAETPATTDAQGGPNPTNETRPEFSMIGNRNRAETQQSRGPVGAWNASFTVSMERPRPDAVPGVQSNGNEMMTASVSFQPTQQWNVSWNTGYSFSTSNFSDHILTFTRQMHDWDANFNFMKSPNGNFSFVFNVKLRANPDIKFDYQQRSNVRAFQ